MCVDFFNMPKSQHCWNIHFATTQLEENFLFILNRPLCIYI